MPHRAKCFSYSILLISHNKISKWALCAPFTDEEIEAQQAQVRWGLTSRQYYFPEALSLAGAHRQVGTSAATVALGCVVKAVPWARPVYMPHYGSHGEPQVPEFPVPTSHRKVHLGLSSPCGAWQVENAWVKLLVNLCALIGPLRKDILPGDELWRIPSRERLFQCVKRVCTAVLMALQKTWCGFFFCCFFSPKSCLNKDSKDGI